MSEISYPDRRLVRRQWWEGPLLVGGSPAASGLTESGDVDSGASEREAAEGNPTAD